MILKADLATLDKQQQKQQPKQQQVTTSSTSLTKTMSLDFILNSECQHFCFVSVKPVLTSHSIYSVPIVDVFLHVFLPTAREGYFFHRHLSVHRGKGISGPMSFLRVLYLLSNDLSGGRVTRR